ncbi:MAG: hypothetical protein ACM3XM_16645 [Mycobacterium leprae]
MFPSTYLHPGFGGWLNPYFGGFGHVNLPQAGTGYGYLWPSYTFPLNFQPPWLYAGKSLFAAV